MNPILFKMLRESLWLSGQQVADYLGLSQSSGARTVRHWESKRTPPEDAWHKLLALKQLIDDEVERIACHYMTISPSDSERYEYRAEVWVEDDRYQAESPWADRLPYAALHRHMIMKVVEDLADTYGSDIDFFIRRADSAANDPVSVEQSGDPTALTATPSTTAKTASELIPTEERFAELLVEYQGEQCSIKEVLTKLLSDDDVDLLIGQHPDQPYDQVDRLGEIDNRVLHTIVSYQGRLITIGSLLVEMFGTDDPDGVLKQYDDNRVAADGEWYEQLEAEIKRFSDQVVEYQGQRQTVAELAASRGASIRAMYAECTTTNTPVTSLKDQDWDLLLDKHSG